MIEVSFFALSGARFVYKIFFFSHASMTQNFFYEARFLLEYELLLWVDEEAAVEAEAKQMKLLMRVVIGCARARGKSARAK
jgi:hypothetical protein